MAIPTDLILTADVVLTVDPAGTVICDGAVAIRDGLVHDVGSADDLLRRYEPSEVIASPGCTILPGWINTHTHLAMNVFRGLADDLTLEEFLERLIAAELRVISEGMVLAGARAGIAECISGGTTTALDMYWYPQTTRAVAREAGFRLVNGPSFMGDVDPDGRDFDGMLARAEAILEENQRESPDEDVWVMPHSAYTLRADQLRRVSKLAQKFRARIHSHASESAGELELVQSQHQKRPLRALSDADLVGPRTVLAHMVQLEDEEIKAVAASGATVAHCPVSNLKLGCGTAPIPKLLRAEAKVGLGTDGAASAGALDMYWAVRMAALLHKGASNDPTMISAERAVRLGTVDGARGLGLRNVGTLEVGMSADLQVVRTATLHSGPSPDAWSAIVYGASAADVQHTVVKGKVVMRDRNLLTIDEDSVKTQLTEFAADAAAACSVRQS